MPIALSQNRLGVPIYWILLDSQSTIGLFYNAKHLTNIRMIDKGIRICCNAGVVTTNMVGDLEGCVTAWYHIRGIASILSLIVLQISSTSSMTAVSMIRLRYGIQMDTYDVSLLEHEDYTTVTLARLKGRSLKLLMSN